MIGRLLGKTATISDCPLPDEVERPFGEIYTLADVFADSINSQNFGFV
jgi:hypothetical protein